MAIGTITSIDPATLERLGEVKIQGEEEVREAVARARAALPSWRHLSFEDRARFILRARTYILQHVDELAELIHRETGKPVVEALVHDLSIALDLISYYAKRTRRFLRDQKFRPHLYKHKRVSVTFQPLGVIGIITPWNFPFVLSLDPVVQALMAGNAAILKPSEQTPLVGLKLDETFQAAGLPPGVFQVLTGDGSTGAALVRAGVDKICFTGSVATGKKVMALAAETLTPVLLELGGKDPMVVCADADLERAAQGAVWGAFANSGQACISIERVYVVEAIAERFIQRVVELTRSLRQGPEGEVELGAMKWAHQVEVVERQIADALARGARLLTGGQRHPSFPGYFFEPTVLTGVDHSMLVMREETFGPVLPIMVVQDTEETIRLANDSAYGLSASVWTRDTEKGKRLARRIQAGAVLINDCLIHYGLVEAPYGGVRGSGFGRLHGELGIREFCYPQTVVKDRWGFRKEFYWFPYTPGKVRLFKSLFRWLYASPWGGWLT